MSAAACFYPTDLHSATLGEGQRDDSLARCGEIRGELMLVWGRQDKLVPPALAAEFAALIPEATTAFLDDCALYPMDERPTDLFALVEEFVVAR